VTATATVTRPAADEGLRSPPRPRAGTGARQRTPRQRFVLAAAIGSAIPLPFQLWLLWDMLTGTINPLRAVPYDNFYDIQARAMFHGHIWFPPEKMGIEAFVHGGHQYTYFGIFPSLLRMPILLVTSSLDGKLTAPSILLAWLLTAVVTAAFVWRLRILMRGPAPLGQAEVVSYGALMTAVVGGSVLLYLAATPFVYNEDFAWSVPLTVASLFALLGIMERPSWWRLAGAAALLTCTSLNRTPAGYGVIIGALLVAGWFAVGRGGRANRRWAVPLAGAGAVAFGANAAVTYWKFGIPVGLPMADQIWASVNAHRRFFLAANGGKAFSVRFLPSTLWAYLDPAGLHLSRFFPFITPPTAPAAVLAGAVMDQEYPTASATATTPLLMALAVWGVVTAFRRHGPGLVRLTRLILVSAACATAGVLLWGYISQRYFADAMPFVIIAAAIGMIELWRRLEGRSGTVRRVVCGAICVLAAYALVANFAISIWPVTQWTRPQTRNFVTVQKDLSFGALGDSVRTGTALPYWAPGGTLFAANHCSGLYISTGNKIGYVPGQQIQHYTWLPVEQDPSFTRIIGLTFNRPARLLTHPVTLMTYGQATLQLLPQGSGVFRVELTNSGTSIPWPRATGWAFPARLLHQQYRLVITTDPNLDSMIVDWYGTHMIGHYVRPAPGPAVVHPAAIPAPGSPTPVLTVSDLTRPRPADPMALCHSLVGTR